MEFRIGSCDADGHITYVGRADDVFDADARPAGGSMRRIRDEPRD